jgi:hypothetical protein
VKAQPRLVVCIGGLALSAAGCRDLSRFDTGETGAYCGRIIDSDFTRSSGFARGLELRLTLDIERLHSAPGTLSSRDGEEPGPCSPAPEFDHAELRVTPQLFADPLSQLEFGSTRDHNFMAWVDSTCNGGTFAVVSLMQTGDVEVRLLRRGPAAQVSSGADAGVATPAAESAGEFGVFQLNRGECEF